MAKGKLRAPRRGGASASTRPHHRVDVVAVAMKQGLAVERASHHPTALLRRLQLRPVPARPTAFTEPLQFTIPDELVTGNVEVDQLNATLSTSYESVAEMRKKIHNRLCMPCKDAISVGKEIGEVNKALSVTREGAASIRQMVVEMGFAPLPEPHWFGNPVAL